MNCRCWNWALPRCLLRPETAFEFYGSTAAATEHAKAAFAFGEACVPRVLAVPRTAFSARQFLLWAGFIGIILGANLFIAALMLKAPRLPQHHRTVYLLAISGNTLATMLALVFGWFVNIAIHRETQTRTAYTASILLGTFGVVQFITAIVLAVRLLAAIVHRTPGDALILSVIQVVLIVFAAASSVIAGFDAIQHLMRVHAVRRPSEQLLRFRAQALAASGSMQLAAWIYVGAALWIVYRPMLEMRDDFFPAVITPLVVVSLTYCIPLIFVFIGAGAVRRQDHRRFAYAGVYILFLVGAIALTCGAGLALRTAQQVFAWHAISDASTISFWIFPQIGLLLAAGAFSLLAGKRALRFLHASWADNGQ